MNNVEAVASKQYTKSAFFYCTMSIGPNLISVLESVLPRILTQACRDVGNPAYGCFDRNWWHYRIRDFASIILQQGGYAVYTASKVCDPSLAPPAFAASLAAGSCRFWNARAVRHGAFEEYYPWEQGYPPLAFSTLAVAKLVAEGFIPEKEVHAGLAIAAKQLATRFEPKAANQQIAGLAALAWLKNIAPELVSDEALASQKKKSLALQTTEGWFWEYDGPDIGYLSVTLDCLWDLVDATGDPDYRHAADQALAFIHNVTALPRCGLGMLNARNTDYVVPYGIARYLADGSPDQQAQAASLLEIFYADTHTPSHFFKAVDDRYWCHYIGHSVARAIAVLNRTDFENPANQPSEPPSVLLLDECGYVFRKLRCGTLSIALRKGGVFSIHDGDDTLADFGWLVTSGRRQYASHWWNREWTILHTSDSDEVSGALVPHKEVESNPWMHMGLRIASLVFGKSIIGLLKKVMIFKKSKSPYTFRRVIAVENDAVVVHDEIAGLRPGDAVAPATRSSKRHVASADSYHAEDALLAKDWTAARETHHEADHFTATTRIPLSKRVPTQTQT